MERTAITLPIPLNGKNLLLHWAQQFNEIVWLDSNQHPVDNLEGILAVESIQLLKSNYQNAFQKLNKLVNSTNDYLFGYIGYDVKNNIEKRLISENIDVLDFDDLFFFQPKKIIEIKNQHYIFKYPIDLMYEVAGDYNQICNTKPQKISTPKTVIKSRFDKETYIQTVEQIQQAIHRGDIYEMNFCQEFYANNCDINPIQTYIDLNQISKSPFASFVKNKDQFLLCASPERFIKNKTKPSFHNPLKALQKEILTQL